MIAIGLGENMLVTLSYHGHTHHVMVTVYPPLLYHLIVLYHDIEVDVRRWPWFAIVLGATSQVSSHPFLLGFIQELYLTRSSLPAKRIGTV